MIPVPAPRSIRATWVGCLGSRWYFWLQEKSCCALWRWRLWRQKWRGIGWGACAELNTAAALAGEHNKNHWRESRWHGSGLPLAGRLFPALVLVATGRTSGHRLPRGPPFVHQTFNKIRPGYPHLGYGPPMPHGRPGLLRVASQPILTGQANLALQTFLLDAWPLAATRKHSWSMSVNLKV